MRENGYYLKVQPKKKYPDFGKGNCVCCRDPLPKFKRKYCCNACSNIYYENTRTAIYVSWQEIRRKIIKRDNFTCQDCGHFRTFLDDHPRAGQVWEVYGDWEVHHIVPISKGGDMWDEDNLTTLCDECHKLRHSKNWQKTKTPTKQLRLEV